MNTDDWLNETALLWADLDEEPTAEPRSKTDMKKDKPDWRQLWQRAFRKSLENHPDFQERMSLNGARRL